MNERYRDAGIDEGYKDRDRDRVYMQIESASKCESASWQTFDEDRRAVGMLSEPYVR